MQPVKLLSHPFDSSSGEGKKGDRNETKLLEIWSQETNFLTDNAWNKVNPNAVSSTVSQPALGYSIYGYYCNMEQYVNF